MEIILNTKFEINKKPARTVHAHSKADTHKINNELAQLDTNLQIDNITVEEAWTHIKTTITNIIDKNTPLKTLPTTHHLPWLTRENKRKINLKQRIYNKSTSNNPQIAAENIIKFKEIRKEIKKDLKESYWKYINNILDPQNDNNHKKLWKFLKSKKKDNNSIPTLKVDGEEISETEQKADIMNKYFTTVFTKENYEDMPTLPNPKHTTMPPIHIEEKGVLKQLLSLNANKATGPDKISTIILKNYAPNIAPILSKLFQKTLDKSKVPEDWKQANITPIYKKGSRKDPQNYRPVSLTSVPSKILEHIIASNIMDHLDKHNILYEYQHGFRSKRSCETQLIMTIQDLAESLNKKKQIDMIILDFAKAFDKVPHNRLIAKLSHYGLHTNVINWIKDFLSDRKQRVMIDGKQSSNRDVTSGVPQGTVLGPILFLIFINDIPLKIISRIRLFADDCLLYREIPTGHTDQQQILQNDLTELCNWADTWQMQFNVSKCHSMQITNCKPMEHTYTMHNKNLEQVKHHPYLGVELDDKLSWNDHINNITSKGNRVLNMLQRNMHSCPKTVKEKVYRTLVRPIIEYCSPIWDPHKTNQIKKIEKIQHKAARFVINRPYIRKNKSNQISATTIVKSLNWPTLETRRQIQRHITLHKIIKNKMAIPSTYLPNHTNRSTRHTSTDKFHCPQSNIDAHKYSLIPRTITERNGLPQEIITTETTEKFKETIQNHYLENTN